MWARRAKVSVRSTLSRLCVVDEWPAVVWADRPSAVIPVRVVSDISGFQVLSFHIFILTLFGIAGQSTREARGKGMSDSALGTAI